MAKLLDGTRIYGSANIDNNLIVSTMNIVPTIVASFSQANTANTTSVSAFLQANAAFLQANTANVNAILAYGQANTANTTAVSSFLQANAAFLQANNAVLKTGNTMTGNLVMSSANIAFITATNTGLYWGGTGLSFIHAPSANTLVFGTSLTERIRVDANGKVGINALASANLQVGGNISAFGIDVAGVNVAPTIVAAFLQANTANTTAVSAFLQANAAFLQANGAVLKTGNTMTGNLVMSGANIAFITSANAGLYWGGTGLSFVHAPAANTLVFGTSLVERMRIDANGKIGINALASANLQVGGNISAFGIDVAGVNVAPTIVAAFGQANTANTTAVSSFLQANVAFLQANTANVNAILAYGQANTANTTAVSAFLQANAAFLQANTANVNAILAYGQANTANTTAVSSFLQANIAFAQANTANVNAILAYGQANTANTTAVSSFLQANIAFAQANTKLNISGGTITGDLTVSGNLTISGNTSYINVQTFVVSDPLLYLAANNYTSDLVDIGFIANYVNATGSNVHTGLMRDSGTKEYFLFQGYDKEPTNNHIDPTGNNFTISMLNANLRTSNIILNGFDTYSLIQSSYNQANTANTTAVSAFAKANLAAPIASPTFTGIVTVPASMIVLKAGDPSEGGQINFEKSSGSSLSGNLNLDLFNNVFRIFEETGSNRGFFLDITKGNTGVGGEILHTNNWFNFISTSGSSSASAFLQANLAFAQANTSNNTPIQKSGIVIGSRNAINFIEGGNVTITVADDSVGNRVNVTIAASGGGGGSSTGNAQAAYDQANAAYNQANNALSNSIIYISDSPPTGIANGFLWWQSNTGSLYVRYGDGDSTQWVATQQQGIGGSPTYSQPASNAIAQSPSQLLISANGLSYTSSIFATSGDASVKNYMLIGTTTNSTPQRLLHGGGNGLIPVRANATMQYTINIVARRTDVTGESAGWTLKGVIDDFNGTVADVGTLYEIIIARDDSNYLVDALANNTSKSLDIVVTGVNTKNIRWVAYVQTVEVSQ